MLMTYLMSYVSYLIHLMYFYLMLGRVMLTCDSFALVGWTSTPKGGLTVGEILVTFDVPEACLRVPGGGNIAGLGTVTERRLTSTIFYNIFIAR